MTTSRKLIISALAVAAVMSAGLVQARGGADVQWSVTIGGPIGVQLYSQPYGQVYSQPYSQPYYSQQVPVYSQPYPVYMPPAQVYDPHHRGHHRHRWDRDGDGVPNRYDPVYNPRWDRDGDGIPNWQDRHDDRGGREFHDPRTWRGQRPPGR